MVDIYKQKIETIIEDLSTSVDEGLDSANIPKIREQYGANKLKIAGEPLWKKLVEPFWNIFVAILLVALIISAFADEYIDAIVIGVVVIINAAIFWVQDYSTGRVLRALKKHSSQLTNVVRDGRSMQVDASELVPGDIVELSEGQKIPADARIISAEAFGVDESVLTGESVAIHKHPHDITSKTEVYNQRNMVFQGTFALTGIARVVVVATGNNTQFGKIAKLSATSERAPMQKKIDSLASILTKVIAAISVVVFLLSLLRGSDAAEALRFVIALAVSSVPEGLPVALSVVLILGMRRMAKKNALVRSMHAIENIGLATAIATDKTGTLTENILKVQTVWSPSQVGDQTLAIYAKLAANIHGSHTSFDPLDGAIAQYTTQAPISNDMKLTQQFSFVQDMRMSGVLWRTKQAYELDVKGSPEDIIKRSRLTATQKREVEAKLHELSSKGFRVIGIASASSKTKLDKLENYAGNFTLKGLIAIADSLRPEARAAIEEAQSAGVDIKMITGDHFETAFQIGKNLGLVTDQSQVYDSQTHPKASSLSAAAVNKHAIFARILPKDKMKILKHLKKDNITVMTGDGVNDVPAISAAHVGVAMGSGSDIAKESSDVVLLDDNFQTIVAAVREGRVVFANIRKMLFFIFSTALGESLTMIGALIVGMPLPVLAVQILWINIVTDTAMVLPLGLEPPESDVMQQPPRKVTAPILDALLISRTFVVGASIAVVALVLFNRSLTTHSLAYAQAIAFTSLVVGQWANAYVARSETKSVFVRMRTPNFKLLLGLMIAVGLQLLVLYGPLRSAFHIPDLLLGDVVLTTVVSFLVVIIAGEAHKLVTYLLRMRSR